MSFLCPVRIRKGRKKKGSKNDAPLPMPGRITGSASIDTLVRVGLEKEDLYYDAGARPKMLILHDFAPCVDDELAVTRGDRVTQLYKENDWMYVIAEDGREGFIPHVYCVPMASSVDDLRVHNIRPSSVLNQSRSSNSDSCGSQTRLVTPGQLNRKTSLSLPSINGTQIIRNNNDLYNQKAARKNEQSFQAGRHNHIHHQGAGGRKDQDVTVNNNRNYGSLRHDNFGHQVALLDRTNSNTNLLQEPTYVNVDVQPFKKKSHGRFIVLFSFRAQDENDINVDRGEFVTVLNKDDPDWYWISRSDTMEGFVPSNFLCPADGQKPDLIQSTNSEVKVAPPSTGTVNMHVSNTTRLVCLYSFTAQASDDLTVTRGEWLYADLDDQVDPDWLWAYAPSTGRCGYVPRAYARPPSSAGHSDSNRQPHSNISDFVSRQSKPAQLKSDMQVQCGTNSRSSDPYLSP